MTWPQYVVPAVASIIGGVTVAAVNYRLTRRPTLEKEVRELTLANITCQEELSKLRSRCGSLERSLRALLGNGLKEYDSTENGDDDK